MNEMNGVTPESVQQNPKDLGVETAQNLTFSRQFRDAIGKADKIVVFINRKFLKNKDIKLFLYTNLLNSYLEYAEQSWWPHSVKNIANFETVYRKATKIISSLHENTMARKLLPFFNT